MRQAWCQALDKELFQVTPFWFSVAAYKHPETVTSNRNSYLLFSRIRQLTGFRWVILTLGLSPVSDSQMKSKVPHSPGGGCWLSPDLSCETCEHAHVLSPCALASPRQRDRETEAESPEEVLFMTQPWKPSIVTPTSFFSLEAGHWVQSAVKRRT